MISFLQHWCFLDLEEADSGHPNYMTVKALTTSLGDPYSYFYLQFREIFCEDRVIRFFSVSYIHVFSGGSVVLPVLLVDLTSKRS